MVQSWSKTLLAAALFSSFGVNAIPSGPQFVVQISSDSASFDGTYLLAQKRSPTYGSVLTISADSATPFYHGKYNGLRSAKGRPRFAEQTAGVNDGRVYFSTVEYAQQVGGFTNLTCIRGAATAPGTKPLTCSSGTNTGAYACAGDGEGSGLFLYDPTQTEPSGVIDDPEDCALVTGFTSIRVNPASTSQLKLVSLS